MKRTDRFPAPEVRAIDTSRDTPWMLSPRETTILHRYASGKTPEEIGVDLGISEKTVSTFLQRARDKMGVPTMHAAAILWDRFVGNAAAPPLLELRLLLDGIQVLKVETDIKPRP